VPEAVELEHGHIAHVDPPRNPATGEEEDTDVGFPGPEHQIAEREWPMKAAMGVLAVLATVGGLIQIPKVHNTVSSFLDPSFAGSKFTHVEPSGGGAWLGLVAGALIGLAGIAIAYRLWVGPGQIPVTLRSRFGALHRFLVNKWYFDEAIDLLAVRPAAAVGRFASSTFERLFVDGTLVGGTTGIVRVGSAAVRGLQAGFVRYYAALLLLGLAGVGLYFLIQAS
jgi:NADH-quinone oxidoreductase subunit L